MALLQTTLERELRSAFSAQAPTAAIATQRMGEAYNTYAQAAMAGAIPPVFIGTEAGSLRGALLPAFSDPRAGTAVKAAQAWSAGITAFWLTPPVAFGGGLVSVITGSVALVSGLTSAFSRLQTDHGKAASLIAGYLHTATLTVTVSFFPGPVLVTLT